MKYLLNSYVAFTYPMRPNEIIKGVIGPSVDGDYTNQTRPHHSKSYQGITYCISTLYSAEEWVRDDWIIGLVEKDDDYDRIGKWREDWYS